MTDCERDKALVVHQLITRYHEMRRIGHHKGTILAAMVQEGHAEDEIEEVKRMAHEDI